MKDRTLPPSERAEKRSVDEQKHKEAQAEAHDRIKRAMRATFNTPDGKIVLRWLYEQSGYSESKVALNPQTGEINPLASTYQAIRETLYCRIRKYLNFNILKEIEYEAEQIS